MKFISTGILSFQLLYPFIVPIGTLIRAIAFTIDGSVYDKFLFISLFKFTANMVGGVLYLCVDISKKEELQDIEEAAVERQFINVTDNNGLTRTKSSKGKSSFHQENTNVRNYYKNLKIFLYFAIPALFHFLSFNTLSLVCASKGKYLNSLQAELKNGRIIFTSLICLCAFRFQYYKHHFVAILFIILGLIVNIPILLSKNDSSGAVRINHFILFFLTYFFDGGKVVLEKKLLEKFKLLPLQAVFIEGICGIIINILFSMVAMVIPCNTNLKVCNEDSPLFDFVALGKALTEPNFYLFLFLILISSIIDEVFSMLSIYYFLPTHQNVADAISSCLLWITINVFYPDETKQKLIFLNSFAPLPGYVLSILGSLLYNEIIVFHFCGLEENTKKEIINRAETEKKEINQENLLIMKYRSVIA